jgi:hypothetical protein
MADYFLSLDAATFSQQIRPALTASWTQRSFEPCRPLCTELFPAVRDYVQRYHLGEEPTLVSQVVVGLPFDRLCWRTLVGEVLLFAAREIPEFQLNAEALCCLLDRRDGTAEQGLSRSASMSAIRQVLRGTHDLTFGTAVYRPEQAGYNDTSDVARLAAYLTAVNVGQWTPDDLRGLADLEDEDRADELAFVKEWFPALVEVYERAEAQQCILVIESIY